jgi:TRAP-type mannitol/chloroaromatic compound transport system substrate-binding protein
MRRFPKAAELVIDRRKILGAGALGAAGALSGCDCGAPTGLPAEAGAIRRREFRMVTTWPKDFPGLGAAADRVARFITELSGGAIAVRVFSAGELVGAFDSFDAVSNGSADLYHGAEYYWAGKSKAYPFFTAVPFGMTAAEIMGWTEFGGGQALWDELAAKFNIKPFSAGNSGHQLAGWFKRPIDSVEDLRGLKIRMPGIGGEVLRRVGASAVAIPGGEIYAALQSGAIDGAEWVGPWNDLAFGFYREAKYYYWPGFHEPGAQVAVGVNLDLWNSFTPQEQAIVRAACHEANHLCLAEFTHFNGVALEQLVREHGVELRRLPDDVVAALARESKIVLEEAASSDELAGRIFESYKASLVRTQKWSEISDEAFMAARRTVFSL